MVALCKGLEEAGLSGLVDSAARVMYFKSQRVALRPGNIQANIAVVGKFQCIAQKIGQHLTQPQGVAHDTVRQIGCEFERQAQATLGGKRRVTTHQWVEHGGKAKSLRLNLHLPSLNF